MDGKKDGWTNGWMEGRMDEGWREVGCRGGWTEGWLDRGWTMERLTNKLKNGTFVTWTKNVVYEGTRDGMKEGKK